MCIKLKNIHIHNVTKEKLIFSKLSLLGGGGGGDFLQTALEFVSAAVVIYDIQLNTYSCFEETY
jgi:hypothetical protein